MDRRQLLPIVDGIVDSVDDYTNGDDNHNDYNGNNSNNNNNNIYINNHLRRQSVSTRLQQFVQLQYPQQLHYRPATIATAELLFNTPDSLVGSRE
jgi:hypothetical protein